jgi:indole-3-glycerol phosphate synthase
VTVLEEIVRRKKDEVAQSRARVEEAELRSKCADRSSGRSLFGVLSFAGGPIRVIAEVKRASPSAGEIGKIADPAALARAYVRGGAAAISVLTDGPSFGGSLDDLKTVRAAVDVPVLRKDFIVDDYQLIEARAAGADAVLLIVAALSSRQLKELHEAARAVGLECLVEIHAESELEQALAVGAQIIGVNNRDLHTLKVDVATSERLIPRIDPRRKAVAESGILGPEEAKRLRAAGAANLLIGEALVRAKDPAALLKKVCDG